MEPISAEPISEAMLSLSKTDYNTVTSVSDLNPPLGLLTENLSTFPMSGAERVRQHFQPIYLFYCYPHNRKLRDQLEAHLMVLKRLRQITLRLNREIPAGIIRKIPKIHIFHQADLILLLVSPDFVASRFSLWG